MQKNKVCRKEEGEGLKDETLRELREGGRERGRGREEEKEGWKGGQDTSEKRYEISMVCPYSSLKAVLSAVSYLIFNPTAK